MRKPEIISNRLCLRRFCSGDLRALAALFADPEITRYLALEDMARDVALDFAAEFIDGSDEEFASHGSGALALTVQGGEELIGYAGVRPLPDRTRALELMYAVQRPMWGKGYATEAAAAVLQWAFATFADLHEVLALVHADNAASLAVLRRLGMRSRGLTERYYDLSLALYVMQRDAAARQRLAVLIGPDTKI